MHKPKIMPSPSKCLFTRHTRPGAEESHCLLLRSELTAYLGAHVPD